MTFEELGLNEQVLESISYMGFEKASPIQEQAIPEIMKGRDVLGCAQTGTGKTAAFMLPILDKLTNKNKNKTSALIIVPTRELALQIDQQIQGFAYFCNVTSTPVYGGGDADDWDVQRKALKEGADVIVATPGKLISHLTVGNVKLDQLDYFILDEADRMLDMGFSDDINKIISLISKERQTLLFSATMPPKIRDLAKKILNNPFEVTIAISKPAEGVLQAAYPVYNEQKNDLITGLIVGKEEYESIIIFSGTKRNVFDIVRALKRKGCNATGISSDLDQDQREEVLRNFKAKKIRIVVATDVWSRGIDIKDISLVINYDVPADAEDYVHRIGRTARAATTGVALTLVNPDDMRKLHRIEQLIEKEIPKVALPEELGEAPQWQAPRKKKPNNRGKGNFKGKKRPFNKGGKKFYKKGNGNSNKGGQNNGNNPQPRKDS